MARKYILKLGFMTVLGLISAGVALQIRLGLSLGMIILFGLVLAVSMSFVFRRMTSREQMRGKA